MKEMAEEACNLLDERNYRVAYDLFSGVHILAKRLQAEYFKDIDQTFLSKTFLTKAICAQKMVNRFAVTFNQIGADYL